MDVNTTFEHIVFEQGHIKNFADGYLNFYNDYNENPFNYAHLRGFDGKFHCGLEKCTCVVKIYLIPNIDQTNKFGKRREQIIIDMFGTDIARIICKKFETQNQCKVSKYVQIPIAIYKTAVGVKYGLEYILGLIDEKFLNIRVIVEHSLCHNPVNDFNLKTTDAELETFDIIRKKVYEHLKLLL